MKKLIQKANAKPKWVVRTLVVANVIYTAAIILQETIDFLPFEEDTNRYLKFTVLAVVSAGNWYLFRNPKKHAA